MIIAIISLIIGISFIVCYATLRTEEGELINIYVVAAIIAFAVSVFMFYQMYGLLPEGLQKLLPLRQW